MIFNYRFNPYYYASSFHYCQKQHTVHHGVLKAEYTSTMWTMKRSSQSLIFTLVLELFTILICRSSSSKQISDVGQGSDFSVRKTRLKQPGLLIPYRICLPNLENDENAMAKHGKEELLINIMASYFLHEQIKFKAVTFRAGYV